MTMNLILPVLSVVSFVFLPFLVLSFSVLVVGLPLLRNSLSSDVYVVERPVVKALLGKAMPVFLADSDPGHLCICLALRGNHSHEPGVIRVFVVEKGFVFCPVFCVAVPLQKIALVTCILVDFCKRVSDNLHSNPYLCYQRISPLEEMVCNHICLVPSSDYLCPSLCLYTQPPCNHGDPCLEDLGPSCLSPEVVVTYVSCHNLCPSLAYYLSWWVGEAPPPLMRRKNLMSLCLPCHLVVFCSDDAAGHLSSHCFSHHCLVSSCLSVVVQSQRKMNLSCLSHCH